MQHKIFIPSGLTINSPFFYIIQHKPSGKYYAGYRSCKRNSNSVTLMTENGYKTSSKLIKGIINNEGLDSFIIRKIKHFQSGKDAINYEVRFLKKVKAMRNPTFLNQSEGSEKFINKGHSFTEEARKRMSDSHKGRPGNPHTKESKMKISKVQKGRKHSEEHIRKFVEATKGKTVSEEAKKKIGDYRRGRPHTEEAKSNMSKAQKGRKCKPFTEEHRKNIGLTSRGRTHTEETKQKMRDSRKIREAKKLLPKYQDLM